MLCYSVGESGPPLPHSAAAPLECGLYCSGWNGCRVTPLR